MPCFAALPVLAVGLVGSAARRALPREAFGGITAQIASFPNGDASGS